MGRYAKAFRPSKVAHSTPSPHPVNLFAKAFRAPARRYIRSAKSAGVHQRMAILHRRSLPSSTKTRAARTAAAGAGKALISGGRRSSKAKKTSWADRYRQKRGSCPAAKIRAAEDPGPHPTSSRGGQPALGWHRRLAYTLTVTGRGFETVRIARRVEELPRGCCRGDLNKSLAMTYFRTTAWRHYHRR